MSLVLVITGIYEEDIPVSSLTEWQQYNTKKAKAIISVIADDIERIGINAVPEQEGRSQILQMYIAGAQGEHDYIVEYLRGLLKEE